MQEKQDDIDEQEEKPTEQKKDQPKVDPLMTGERAVKKTNNRGKGVKDPDLVESGAPEWPR